MEIKSQPVLTYSECRFNSIIWGEIEIDTNLQTIFSFILVLFLISMWNQFNSGFCLIHLAEYHMRCKHHVMPEK